MIGNEIHCMYSKMVMESISKSLKVVAYFVFHLLEGDGFMSYTVRRKSPMKIKYSEYIWLWEYSILNDKKL